MRKGLIIVAALLVGCLATALGQQLGPVVSAWYQLPGMAAPLYKWLHVDPPVMLTVDSAGAPHLGMAALTEELPVPISSGVFSVAAPPAFCSRNGLVQSQSIDYSISGLTIKSPYWQPDDQLVCWH